MSVLTTIPEHFPIQYERNWLLKLQQERSALDGTFFQKNGSGESIKFNRLDTMEMTDITTRGGDTVATDISTEHRWIWPGAAEAVNRFDEFDEVMLGQIVLPQSEVIQTQAFAVNRKFDNIKVAAFTATAYEGKTGTTTVAFDTNMAVAVNSVFTGSAVNSGMTWYKLAKAKYLLDHNEVPEGERYIGWTAKHAASIQWVTTTRMSGGTILGFKPIRCQRFVLDTGTDVRTCPFWHKSCMGFGVWTDKKVYMDILPMKRHSLQIRSVINCGAARIEEKGVGVIYADESP